MMLIKTRLYSPSDYLAWEEKATERSEFIDGEIRLMAGGTTKHNELVTNLCVLLKPQIRKQGGRVYAENVKLRISLFNVFTYPDVMVITDQPCYEGDTQTTILNPTVIFEILSEGTRDYDQGRKFEFYRSVSSLQEYVLIDQDRYLVMVYRRSEENQWLLQLWSNENDCFELQSLGITIAFKELYEGI